MKKGKKNNLIPGIIRLDDKINNHSSDIIFGILSGTGLVLLVDSLIWLIGVLIPQLKAYSIFSYLIIYGFILGFTTLLYTRGWFRAIYLTSSLILSLTYIYMNLFGLI